MFSRKTATFYFLINLRLKTVLTSLRASFALSENKNLEASWLIIGTPLHSHCYLSLSVWCVFCSFTLFLSVLFVFHRKNEQIYDFYISRAYFKKVKPPGIGRFVKMPFFKNNFFVSLNKMCQKHILIWAIQPPLVLLDCPSALFSNKGALLKQRRALFQYYFD